MPRRSPEEVAAAKAQKAAERLAKLEVAAKRRADANAAKVAKKMASEAKKEEQRKSKEETRAAKTLQKKPKAISKTPTFASSKRGLLRRLTEAGDDGKQAKRRRKADSADGIGDTENIEGELEAQDGELEKLACLSSSALARDRAGFIAKETGLQRKHVAGVIRLFEEGNTLPFIARYRKEHTGSMDENSLRRVERSLRRVDAVEQRRKTIAVALLRLGKLDEVLAQLLASTTIEELEDLYEPYKTKRRTRAQAAREKGLAPLADLIDQVGGRKFSQDPKHVALSFCSDEKGVATAGDALQGARDIVAERWSRKNTFKEDARAKLKASANLTSKRKSADADIDRQYANYWNFNVPLRKLWNHQFFAVQRGEKEKVLNVSFTCPPDTEEYIVGLHVPGYGNELWLNELWAAVTDGLKRLLRPTIEREWRRSLKECAEDEAYDTYRRNLKSKLLLPPLFQDGPPGCIVGLDPGYKNGCKLAVVAATGSVLETAVIFLMNRQHEAEQTLISILERLQPVAIAIGNGTASGETEVFVRQVLQSTKSKIIYTIADESGASIYSASPLASAELPGLDVALRGAVSIARRVVDPLAELVKIDPQSIGVGLYQHDVDQKRLKIELHGVVEDCVNAVGVDLNTASPALLRYVAGIGAKLSETLVAHRESNGAFGSRKQLHKVKGLGAAAFEQCAGFLRITNGREPLDATAVHPESYDQARALQQRYGAQCERLSSLASLDSLAGELKCGVETLRDIVSQLKGLEVDPRASQPPQVTKDMCGKKKGNQNAGDGIDAQEMGLGVDGLKPGMQLRGIVRNVVAFGAFVDIGVHHEGLLHYSKYPKPLPRPEWPSVNDRVVVEIESPPEQRGKRWRISLALRKGAAGG